MATTMNDNGWLAPIVGGFMIVSDQDRHLLAHRWRVLKRRSSRGGFYVIAFMGGKTVYFHRLVMGAGKGQEVDHINGDALDNRRSNLRIATRSQNCANTHRRRAKSGFRGVYPLGSKWQAKIGVNGGTRSIGGHATPEAAARAYDRLAKEHHGEFAIVNFPGEENV